MSATLAFDQPFVKAVQAGLAAELADAIAIANDAARPIEDRVHQARVATKEMRALLRLIRPAFHDFRQVNDALGAASRILAPYREAVVRSRLVHELVEGADPETGLAAFAGRSEELAGPLPGQAEQEAALAAFSRDLGALAANAAIWRIEPKGWTCLAEGAGRTYRAVRQAMTDACLTAHPADFHDWRKHVKYHYRQMLLLSPLPDGPSWRRCKAVARLGEVLGKHHDLEALVLHLEADAVLSDAELEAFRQAVAPLQAGLVRTAARDGRERFARKPGTFESRIEKAIARGTGKKAAG